MRFDVITLFPEMFLAIRDFGITRRAFAERKAALHTWQLRTFTDDPYRRVDDRPYGGGAGMVLLAEPIYRAMKHIHNEHAHAHIKSRSIYLSARGSALTQSTINRWLEEFNQGSLGGLTLLCGRYEGVDQRVIAECIDEEINVGAFVVSGGELPAMMLLDALIRRLPGVIDPASIAEESFAISENDQLLLEYPQYTRPESFQGRPVPEVLLSGNHAQIAAWRRAQAQAHSAQIHSNSPLR